MTDRDRAWRCFVAVPIGSGLRGDLATAVESWRRRPDMTDLRWSHPAGWHVTLAFLGATDPTRVPGIRAAIERAVMAVGPFVLPTGDVGAFPTARRARVAWYGIADDDGRLAGVAASVRRELGLEVDRFRAHITLARSRGQAALDLSAWVREAEVPTGVIEVGRVELMRSHLGRGPARYESLAAVPLGAPVHA
ncbi:MAG: RNA 2',3'-cyclic phosphodiesterase [Candidatus Limnocylindria bacterium]